MSELDSAFRSINAGECAGLSFGAYMAVGECGPHDKPSRGSISCYVIRDETTGESLSSRISSTLSSAPFRASYCSNVSLRLQLLAAPGWCSMHNKHILLLRFKINLYLLPSRLGFIPSTAASSHSTLHLSTSHLTHSLLASHSCLPSRMLHIAAVVTAVVFVLACSPSLSSALDNGLALRPQMGWNSWNHFGCNISEHLIRDTARTIVDSGLAAAGYNYINLDDCWAVARDNASRIVADPVAWPSGMFALGESHKQQTAASEL